MTGSLERNTKLGGDLPIVFARIFAGPAKNLSREQAQYGPVFIRGPHSTVKPQEARAGTLFSAEAKLAVAEARHEPFETNWRIE